MFTLEESKLLVRLIRTLVVITLFALVAIALVTAIS